MGINKKSEQALADLKFSLRKFTHVEEVHFTANGDHYFSCEEFGEPILDAQGKQKGKKETKKYGFLRSEVKVSKVIGERKFFKNVSVDTPEAEITETLSRDEVLAYEFSADGAEGGETTKVAKGTKGNKAKKTDATDGAEGGETTKVAKGTKGNKAKKTDATDGAEGGE